MNASILAIVDDEKVAPLMDAFREMDAATRMRGPGVCLEYRKRILIPLLAAHLPHILPGGADGIVLGYDPFAPFFTTPGHLPRTDRNPGFVGSAIFGDRKPYLKRMRQCGAKNEAMHHKVPGIALFFLHLHP